MTRLQRSISNIKDQVSAGAVGSTVVRTVDKVYIVGKNTTKSIASTAGTTEIAKDIKSIGSSIFSGLNKVHKYFTEEVNK